MSDAWNDAVLIEAFDAAITKYEQMHDLLTMKESVASENQIHDLSITKDSVASQGLEKEDQELVDSQPASAEERFHDFGTEPRHHV